MSNEDLALQIQAGEAALMVVLWERLERLVHWKANRVAHAIHPSDSFAAEDLSRDLFQAGYIALDNAVKTYSAECKASFTTWFMFQLKTAFAEATGWRTERQRRDPLHSAISLDAPVTGDDGSETQRGDLIPDRKATEQLNSVEEKTFQEELQQALSAVLSTMPEDQQEIIRLRYLNGISSEEIAKAKGTNRNEIRKAENKALRNLRDPQRAKFLRPYVDYNFFCGTGLASFLRSGMSAQERYLDHIERIDAHRKGVK